MGPDDPVDVRRKKIFDRLKNRAVRDGIKTMRVDSDTLIIDDVPHHRRRSQYASYVTGVVAAKAIRQEYVLV